MSDPTPPAPDEPPPTGGASAEEAGAETSRPGPPDVERLVSDAVAAGPGTVAEIARRIEQAAPGAIGDREGLLYPFLLGLERRGALASAWADRADGRRRVWGPPGAVPPGPVEPGPEARVLATDRMLRVADAATSALDFAPRLAEDLRAEIARHLVEAAALRRAAGEDADAAEAAALRAFGDSWRVAIDLSRVARGRRTVIFPRSRAESALAVLLYDAGILATIVVTIVLVRLLVVNAFHIPTKSMEPTLHGDRDSGDRILVLRLSPPPSRFDVEVFEGWGPERKQYVKRCVGLPGELVEIAEGDLWIDGRLVRKDGADLDALLFPVFDARVERTVAARDDRSASEQFRDRWSYEGGTKWAQWPRGDFECQSSAEKEPAVLRWRDRLEDAFYDPDGTLHDGIEDVADGRLTIDVTPLSEDARLLVRWARGPDRCDAVLRGEQPGVALVVDGAEVARAPGVALAVGATTRVRFSLVDRVLRLEVGGDLVLRHELPEPEDRRRKAPGADVSVRVPEGKVRLAPVRLERDVHWTSEYEDLGRDPLGPDEFFMLGDNSSNSQDSRSKGPVHRSRLVGRPLLIVWPPSRFGVPR